MVYNLKMFNNNLKSAISCINYSVFRYYGKQLPKNLKGRSKSSQEWLTRQLADPYVEKARMMNYRCRSVFKLQEIQEKFKILKPGDVVVDCGAAPGSWTQFAVEKCNANAVNDKEPIGAVFSIDMLHFHAIKGATTFGGMDFTQTTSQERLRTALGDRRVNCVLSDMAPNATGVRMLDQENIINLCYDVLKFALKMSSQNANLIMKVWDNNRVQQLETDLNKVYEKVKRFKPNSSRSDSAEHFLVARGFKTLQNVSTT